MVGPIESLLISNSRGVDAIVPVVQRGVARLEMLLVPEEGMFLISEKILSWWLYNDRL